MDYAATILELCEVIFDLLRRLYEDDISEFRRDDQRQTISFALSDT